jgi:hypothetical protein
MNYLLTKLWNNHAGASYTVKTNDLRIVIRDGTKERKHCFCIVLQCFYPLPNIIH